jgi:mono/diheme cytochrome c family protein
MQRYHTNKAQTLGILLLALLPINAFSENFERGQELFQHHCQVCHGDLKLAGKKSKVKKLGDLKIKISSWAAHSGTDWAESEILDVMFYLNKSFYHFKQIED